MRSCAAVELIRGRSGVSARSFITTVTKVIYQHKPARTKGHRIVFQTNAADKRKCPFIFEKDLLTKQSRVPRWRSGEVDCESSAEIHKTTGVGATGGRKNNSHISICYRSEARVGGDPLLLRADLSVCGRESGWYSPRARVRGSRAVTRTSPGVPSAPVRDPRRHLRARHGCRFTHTTGKAALRTKAPFR
ncbi:hypothetical protein AAFF_G00434930 [Aldrovandia affinis]|uniref:Uncharacterized protein n=1 Tax=Aldrovandia affinis TaxID=143900 RepID=A0AAD7S8D9_9TELE|nr:hypothetical protein AAFF_G00434930 [Aldrovandia affinis]